MLFLTASVILIQSCSKSSTAPVTPPPADVCAGKNIVITATPTASSSCSNDGKIDISVTGSTAFMYKLNSSGVYQAGHDFSNLAAATYTVFVKDGEGCEKSASVIVTTGGTPGPLFADVKTLLAGKCQSCHSNSNQSGGVNFAPECNIIDQKSRIKARAVDAGTMPPSGPLSQSQKDIITNWINGGGGYNN